MSASIKVKFGKVSTSFKFSLFPVEKLSIQITLKFCDSRVETKCEPMKPAPPAIKAVGWDGLLFSVFSFGAVFGIFGVSNFTQMNQDPQPRQTQSKVLTLV